MTSKVLASVDRVEALERDLEAAMAALDNDRQRAFVRAFTACGIAAEAARAAGYAPADAKRAVRRLKADDKVKAAIKLATELRERTSTLDKVEAAAMLEQMLAVRLDDLLVFDADTGRVPIDLKDWATLTTAQQQRIRYSRVRTRRSAQGERAHIVSIDLELVPALEILDRLAKLRDWNPDKRLSVEVAPVHHAQFGGRAESREARDAAREYMESLEG